MSAEENKEVIKRLIEEVYNGDDLDLLDEIVAPEVVNHTDRCCVMFQIKRSARRRSGRPSPALRSCPQV